jgi:tRNA/rRNA methyltransferase
MANFGFAELLVVDPYDPTWRNARSAVDSEVVMENARCVTTLAEAVSRATLVFGTGSLESRKPEQPVVQLPFVGPVVKAELACGGRIAIVFGPEKHGLTREDLSWCHRLIEIPTSTLQPSMNLGQAVAVCLYEVSTRALLHLPEYAACPPLDFQSHQDEEPTHGQAHNPTGDLVLLAGLIEEVMVAARYSPKGMQEANQHDLRLSLRRMSFSRHDLRRALGLFRRVLHALNR